MRQALSTIQWAMFILAGSVVAPLAIGQAYGMTPVEIADFVQRSLFVLGVVSVLQALWGHRLPIAEGPAALWWGVFLLFASLAPAMGLHPRDVLPALELGLIASGLIFLAVSACGWMDAIRRLFSPTVVGTYFLLLVAQMSGPFVTGILGAKSGAIDGKAATISLATLAVSLVLARSRHQLLRSYSVLIAIAFGWSLFVLAGLYHKIEAPAENWVALPHLLSWGWPHVDGGIMLTSLIVTVLLLSNLIASMEAVERVVHPAEPVSANRSGLIMGISQLLSAAFSTIGFVPVSYTAGFILTTRMKEKWPFLMGSLLLVAVSFVPAVTLLFASIPVSVGYASVFLSFANMIGMGIREIAKNGLDERQGYIVGVALMAGVGCMFLPASFLAQLPPYISPLVSNGLLMGVLICMALERLVRSRPAFSRESE